MHFLILGGSGRTGKVIIEEALSKGHTITALVRNQGSLTPTTGLTVIQGSPLNSADIETAITNSPAFPTAIVTALNSLRKSDNPFSAPVSPPTMMEDVAKSVVAVAKKFGIKKLVTISAVGVGDSWGNVILPMRMIMSHSGMSVGVKDHNKVEKVVRDSGLEWTLVRPVMLSDSEKKEVKVWGNDGKGAGLMPGVSRKSVAGFIVECLETNMWSGKTPVISE